MSTKQKGNPAFWPALYPEQILFCPTPFDKVVIPPSLYRPTQFGTLLYQNNPLALMSIHNAISCLPLTWGKGSILLYLLYMHLLVYNNMLSPSYKGCQAYL